MVQRLAVCGEQRQPDARQSQRIVRQPGTGDSEEQQSGLPAASGAAVFNLHQAVKTCYGRYDMFQEMLEYFFPEADECVEQIRTALDHGNVQEVGFAAHRLKGTLVYLGAQPAVEAAQHLEDLGGTGDLTDVAEAIEEFARQIELLKEALATHYKAPCRVAWAACPPLENG